MIWLLPFLNLLGGRGLFPADKLICRFIGMPLVISWYAGFDWYVTAVSFAGIAFWAVWGHGKYFAAFHGRYDTNETEIGWIDAIGEAVFPYDGVKETNRERGMLCMGLRGLYLWPMFLLLFPVSHYAPLIGFGMFLQGQMYGFGKHVPERWAVPLAEVLTGLLIAVLLAFTLGIAGHV